MPVFLFLLPMISSIFGDLINALPYIFSNVWNVMFILSFAGFSITLSYIFQKHLNTRISSELDLRSQTYILKNLYPLTILKLFYLGIYLLFILITLSYIFAGRQSLNATTRDFLLYTNMILIFIVIDPVFRFYNKFSNQNDISGALKSFILYFYLSFIVLIFYRILEGREILEGVQFQLFIIFTILILISGIDIIKKKVEHEKLRK